MKKYLLFFTTLLLLTSLLLRTEATEGFYKDVFMDGGVGLNPMKVLIAADSLDFSMEFIAHGTVSMQAATIIGNEHDDNGVLLYPDGEPRFRVIFTNGGSSKRHGESLGE